PDILFINQPDLYIDALSGDDDIVIRAPAPNDANWNVHVRVAGGPPASPTGDQGDVLEFETPGQDNLFFTPTGPESGSLLVDVGGAVGVFDNSDTLIDFGPFTFVCPTSRPPFTYISSPGGVEEVVYNGLDGLANPPGGVVVNPNDVITINGTAGD